MGKKVTVLSVRNLPSGGRDKQDKQQSNCELGLDGEGRSALGTQMRASLTWRLPREGNSDLAAVLGWEEQGIVGKDSKGAPPHPREGPLLHETNHLLRNSSVSA